MNNTSKILKKGRINNGKIYRYIKKKNVSERKARIEKRVQEALAEMPLAELRQAKKITQQQLAEALKVKQASVSKMENQTDMYISTMRKYIQAMGGELEIVAKFPEGNVKVEAFSDL